MRIADIIADHVEPGAAILDRTPEEATLSPYAVLPPNLRLTYVRRVEELPVAARTVVLHGLPDVDLAVTVPGLAIHVLFAARAEAYLQLGLLETLAERGLELVSTHGLPHKSYRCAVVVRTAAPGQARVVLRLENEYRFQRLFLRAREDELQELRQQVAANEDKTRKVQEEEARLRGDAERRAAGLATELMELRTAYQRLSRAHDQARVASEQERARADGLQERFDRSQKRLVSARQSISFRIGRATRVAAKDMKRNPLGAPRRWLQVFRGPDEVLADVQRETMTQARASRDLEDVERLAVERSHFLLGLEPLSGPLPGIAGVVGHDLASELASATRFRPLAPNGWRHLLELEPPAYVLVTSDGLAPGTAWGSFGLTAARGTDDALRELVTWCRARQLPIVYWDTAGSLRPRLGLPRGLTFDAIFSVSARACGERSGLGKVSHLPAGVEPLLYHPGGVRAAPPDHPIYAGAFDQRSERGQLASLRALLEAAAGRGLIILDAEWRRQGAEAAALRFPPALAPLTRRPPPLAGRLASLRQAGLVLATEPWDVLRGLALGAHVIAAVAEPTDAILRPAWTTIDGETSAREAVERAVRRPRLDATWRRAHRHLLGAYGLRARLDEIARVCGTGPVATATPTLSLVAHLRGGSELDELVRLLGAQTHRPAEVRVLYEGDLEVTARLAPVLGGARLVAQRANGANGQNGKRSAPAGGALDDLAGSHVLRWQAGLGVTPHAFEDLIVAARLSGADVVAAAAPGDAADTPPFAYRDPGPQALRAVRREILDADPETTGRCFVVRGAEPERPAAPAVDRSLS